MVVNEERLTAELTMSPITPSFGVIVTGLDLKEPLGPAELAAVKDAVLRYKVVAFPGQGLDDRQQQGFARQLGMPFDIGDTMLEEETEAGLHQLEAVTDFHADYMFRREGPTFSALQLLKTPAVGGDTMWADLVGSYAALSEPLRAFLEPLTAVHISPLYYAHDDALRKMIENRRPGHIVTPDDIQTLRQQYQPSSHPLVRTIQETGQKNYWISKKHTSHIAELSRDESDAVLGFLYQHQLLPRFVIRWRWGLGDLVLWDHRTTLHSGVADYAPGTRRLQRSSVGANIPVK